MKMSSALVMISLIGMVRTKGAVRTIGNGQVEDGTHLDNYEWWSAGGEIPTYIWVIAGIITLISIILGLWSECCPNCGLATRVKAYLLSTDSGESRRGQGLNQLPDQTNILQSKGRMSSQSKMLPISDDEFVVTFKN